MDAPPTMVLLWAVVVILGSGLGSAVFARWSEGSAWQTCSQWLFFGFLAMVGLMAILSSLLGPGCWAASSATLAMMVLATTYEPRRSGRATW